MAINYAENRKYFNPSDFKLKWGIGLTIVGVIFFLAFIAAGVGIIGLLIAALGIWLIVLHVKGSVADQYIDQQADSEVANVVNEGLRKLGLDKDQVALIEPLVVSGYDFVGGVPWKKGKDLKWRTGQYEAVVLYFNDQQVYTYTKTFSLVQEGKQSSLQDEYFYKDIVSIAVAEAEARTPTGETTTVNKFFLRNTGGEAVTSSVRNDDGSFQQRVNAARQLLREKKNV